MVTCAGVCYYLLGWFLYAHRSCVFAFFRGKIFSAGDFSHVTSIYDNDLYVWMRSEKKEKRISNIHDLFLLFILLSLCLDHPRGNKNWRCITYIQRWSEWRTVIFGDFRVFRHYDLFDDIISFRQKEIQIWTHARWREKKKAKIIIELIILGMPANVFIKHHQPLIVFHSTQI